MSKKETIRRLQEDLTDLEQQHQFLIRDYNRKCQEIYEADQKVRNLARKREFSGDIAFDFWPLRDWIRLELKKWKPGNYWQLCVGPLRIEFYEN